MQLINEKPNCKIYSNTTIVKYCELKRHAGSKKPSTLGKRTFCVFPNANDTNCWVTKTRLM